MCSLCMCIYISPTLCAIHTSSAHFSSFINSSRVSSYARVLGQFFSIVSTDMLLIMPSAFNQKYTLKIAFANCSRPISIWLNNQINAQPKTNIGISFDYHFYDFMLYQIKKLNYVFYFQRAFTHTNKVFLFFF